MHTDRVWLHASPWQDPPVLERKYLCGDLEVGVVAHGGQQVRDADRAIPTRSKPRFAARRMRAAGERHRSAGTHGLHDGRRAPVRTPPGSRAPGVHPLLGARVEEEPAITATGQLAQQVSVIVSRPPSRSLMKDGRPARVRIPRHPCVFEDIDRRRPPPVTYWCRSMPPRSTRPTGLSCAAIPSSARVRHARRRCSDSRTDLGHGSADQAVNRSASRPAGRRPVPRRRECAGRATCWPGSGLPRSRVPRPTLPLGARSRRSSRAGRCPAHAPSR